MIPITAGMSPSEFITAMNSNIASVGFIGKSVTFDDIMLGHEIGSAFKLNSIGTFGYGKDASYISRINSELNSITTEDIYISGATDVKTYGATGDGTTDDSASINAAVAAGNIIIQNGTFKLTASIKIPSNRTVYLKNCIVSMANTSYDNFFRNSDFIGGNVNINIIGLGNAELDGNCDNNHDYPHYSTYGVIYPPSWGGTPPYSATAYRYIALFMCNVDGFDISGLFMRNIPQYTCMLQKAINGKFHDIYLECATVLSNQDGIDLYVGCHDIEIYNLAVNNADDFSNIGVSNYFGFEYEPGIEGYNVGDTHDIYYHDIDIYNMRAGATLALLGGDGRKIYNIRQEEIRVRIGGSILYTAYSGWCDVINTKDEIHDLTFTNIQFDVMQTRHALFYAFEFFKDVTATGIINNTGEPMTNMGYVMENFTINGHPAEDYPL